MIAFIRNHALAVTAGAVVVLAGMAWLAFGYFGVHTLFIDDEVSESVPTFDAVAQPTAGDDVATPATTPSDTTPSDTNPPDAATADPSVAPSPDGTDVAGTVTGDTVEVADEPAVAPEIVTEFAGVFESDAHPTSGNAIVLGNGTGQRFLRFEEFETDNGPDLNVYLVNSSTGDVSDYIDLGDLKGNIGEQNYEIPEGVDLDVYDQVVIWCVRFGVGFGDALLMAV